MLLLRHSLDGLPFSRPFTRSHYIPFLTLAPSAQPICAVLSPPSLPPSLRDTLLSARSSSPYRACLLLLSLSLSLPPLALPVIRSFLQDYPHRIQLDLIQLCIPRSLDSSGLCSTASLATRASMSDAGTSTPMPGGAGAATARQKRVRGAVDLNNIVDGERTRRRTSNALDVSRGLVRCFCA